MGAGDSEQARGWAVRMIELQWREDRLERRWVKVKNVD